jgi:hypothetical protein
MSPQARDHSFDELTRGLASGTLSRGKALRLMGAALLGGALAFTPKVAEAALHKCNSAGECPKGGSCCAGTCCGGQPGPSCFPSAPICGKGRVATICADTEEFGTTCLAGCFGEIGTTCTSTADCEAQEINRGMVCALLPGETTKICISPCKGGRK